MSASSTTPPALRSLIDLPADIVIEIIDLVSNDKGVVIDSAALKLLLTHRRLLEAADQRVVKHQHYLRYRVIVIDSTITISESLRGTTRPSTVQSTVAWCTSDLNVSTKFDSPLVMLVEMHKDRVIANYVRFFTYLPPSSNLKYALRCPMIQLEVFDQNQEAVDIWDEGLTATVDSMLPPEATTAHRDSWIEGLWQQDNGQGIDMLLRLLPHLNLCACRVQSRDGQWGQAYRTALADILTPSSDRLSGNYPSIAFRPFRDRSMLTCFHTWKRSKSIVTPRKSTGLATTTG